LTFVDTDPQEQHYPGDIHGRGKRGIPNRGINAGHPFSFWVYGVDHLFNAMPFHAGAENVYLQTCESALRPHTITPAGGGSSPGISLYTDVVRPTDQGVDQVQKVNFQVEYATTGYAGLKAVTPSGKESQCEHFSVLGEGPTPDDNIKVFPNPGGTPANGDPINIDIGRVALGGGKIYGKIYDCFGYIIRDFSEELQQQYYADPQAKYWHLTWDYKNEKGHTVANGCYHFCVEVVQVEKAGVWKKKIGVVW
jgi:hypothetical protein